MDIASAMQESLTELSHRRARATERTYRNAMVHFLVHLSEQFDVTPPPLPEKGKKGEQLEEPFGVDTSQLRILHFNDFLPYLGDMSIEKRSLAVYITGVHYFLKWLIRKELVELSFSEYFGFEENVKDWTSKIQREPRIPPEGAVDKMMDATPLLNEGSPAQERDIAIILFLYSTGCRNAELCGLKIRDINVNKGTARVTGKGDKSRPVFFNLAARQALEDYWTARKNRSPNAYAFTAHDRGMKGRDTKGLTTSSVRDIVDKVSALAGLDRLSFTPHSFRHAFATRMLRETGNLALVQDLLGHADPKTTRVYATINEEDLKAAHQRVFGE